MADSGTTFSYSRLAIAKDQKQIRLLKLLPSLNPNQISCTLEVVNWAPELQYAAISYVWGDPTMKKTISVNDQPIHITDNLYTALWYIRKNDMLRQDGSEQPLPLWADAVCIDQDNNEERNHQVSLMGSIYGSASKVIYWLGRLDDGFLGGDAAITAIQEMAEAAFHDSSVLDTESLKNFLAAHEGLNVPSHDVFRSLTDVPPIWESIGNIIQREFWERVWIIQEIALPVSQDDLWFTCGNSTVNWTRFLQFLQIVEIIRDTSDNLFGFPKLLHNHLSMLFNVGTNKLNALRQFRRRDRQLGGGYLPIYATAYKASNPLDYVYGFRAVLNIQLAVNYEKSKKEVYMDWFKDAMKYSAVSDLTAFAGIGLLGPANQEWPSWLPDLASVYETPNKLAIRSIVEEGPDTQQTPGDIDGNVLHTSGVRLGDTVAKIFKPEPGALKQENGIIPGFIHYVCFSILANASSHHPLSVTPLRAFLITVVDCFKTRTNSEISFEHPLDTNDPMLLGIVLSVAYKTLGKPLRFSHDHYLSTYGPGWDSMGLLDGEHLAEKLQERTLAISLSYELLRPFAMNNYVPGGLLSARLEQFATFQTTNGHIGIGPPGIKEGDELWLSERDTPILLRLERENDKMVTKFVGVCYIHKSSVLVMKDSVASGGAKYERLSLH
jgi:hypothetical protein